MKSLAEAVGKTPALFPGILLILSLTLPVRTMGGTRTSETRDRGTGPGRSWRAVHLMSPGQAGLPVVKRAIVEKLVPMGVNVLILEVDYGFSWKSHPELATAGALTREDAKSLTELCRARGVRLIPLFNCLGHQSWGKTTFPLLSKYREFDETPDIPLDNPGIYCRSWCPRHPGVNRVVFALMDELLEAFEADSLHVLSLIHI
ncbi:MAG: family 20 glycosylhydrolase, partial [Verrucomicrobiae bacterium]|nr:family 20 glycosylhydrolase [Verrucomicrobiae bacterium]